MMKTILAACLLLLVTAVPARAHPGVGIVIDRQGSVFYTDLQHVWRIAPDGRKSIAVRDVHTHELGLEPDGSLVGEDSEYLGGDRWRVRVWRRTPNGRVTDIVPWRDGFWREYGFVRDAAGATYWTQCPERRCSIRKRGADGRVTTFAPNVRWTNNIQFMAAAPDGSLIVVDGRDLRRIDRGGRAGILARNVGEQLFGLWVDARNHVYVAVYNTRSVLRVAPDGRVTTVARSPAPWGPTGVTVAPSGDLWLLEYNTRNEARVRRIRPDGRSTVY